MILVVRLSIAKNGETGQFHHILGLAPAILNGARRIHHAAEEPLALPNVVLCHPLLPLLIINDESNGKRTGHALQHLFSGLQLRAADLQLSIQLHSSDALKLIPADLVPRTLSQIGALQPQEQLQGTVALGHTIHRTPEGLHAEGGPAAQFELNLLVCERLGPAMQASCKIDKLVPEIVHQISHQHRGLLLQLNPLVQQLVHKNQVVLRIVRNQHRQTGPLPHITGCRRALFPGPC
mmetsp:Transcript_102103/g.233908  ORF Transcript_102103/g.233908 Transcript_102103/m.233908 type:complete len:236 (-) Transcript_102103:350-1057(-)